MSSRLLLLSNSTASGFPYLQLWVSTIMSFLSGSQTSGPTTTATAAVIPNSTSPAGNLLSSKNVIFIPYAGVTIDWDTYTSNVQSALPELNITGIHRTTDPIAAVRSADVIMIGGGNTFSLLSHLQSNNLMPVIRERVTSGQADYIGWSAGSNVATPDIATTNDMPVMWPSQESALNLIDININPHYNAWKPKGLQGEGRDDRLNEAIRVKKRPIVALSEGLAVLGEKHSIFILKSPARLRDPGTPLVLKVWKPLPEPKFSEILTVDLEKEADKFSLDQFLIPDGLLPPGH